MKPPLHYEILREIGRGGMASVHEAMHLPLRRRVAIKVMLPQLAGDPKSVARFEREARSAASVRHPHVVEIFDFGSVDGAPFLVMELLAGETLAARLAHGTAIALEEAVAFVLPIASAVAHAHKMDIVHRDLKPANVFLSEGIGKRPWPKVLDFGISKQTGAGSNSLLSEGLTGAASMLGTLAYMAPEQIHDAGAVTAKTDQYALAVILYECVTGRLPFFGANPYQLMHNILNADVTAPSALVPQLPGTLDEILLRALARDPANRYPSVHAFASHLLSLGGRETCAMWASEFAGGQEAAGRTQNGDLPPRPPLEPRKSTASRPPVRPRLGVFVIAGAGVGVLLLVLLGMLARQRVPRATQAIESPIVRESEPSVVAPDVAIVPFAARNDPSELAPTETKSPPVQLAGPRGKVSVSPKLGDAPPIDSRDAKSVKPSRPPSAETQPAPRPRAGTNEAPILE